nr:hypothetical protein [Pedobacter panaciterrae]
MKDGGHKKINYVKQLDPSQYSPSSDDACDDLSFSVILQNMQPALLKHSKDDVLDVTLDQRDHVIAVGKNGLCGTINAPQVLQLIKCLQKQKKFKAVILELDSDRCKVRVRSSV